MNQENKVALITGVTGPVGAHLSKAGRASARHDILVKLGSRMAARLDALENRVLQFDADAATQAAHLAAERNWCVGIRFGALTCPHEEIAPYTLSAHLASH